MKTYKPSTAVSLTLSLTNQAGEVLTPTAIQWRVLDETEVEIQAWTAVPTMPLTSDLTLVVPSLVTGLAPGTLRGIRTIEVEVTTTIGTTFLSATIMLQGTTALAFGVNTFQSYGQAMLTSQGFTGLLWADAARETQENALIEAYARVMRLPIGMHFDNTQSMLTQDTSYVFGFANYMLRDMTPEQMLTLYPPMLKDLMAAQLLEADNILNPGVFATARDSGLVGITVGASSQFFRNSKPLDLPLCPRAMAQVQRWVRFGAKIGRS